MKIVVHFLFMIGLFCASCSAIEEEVSAPPSEESFIWKGLRVSLNIPDYAGKYELDATSVTLLQPPAFAEIQGDAWSEDGYARLKEEGEILSLTMTKVEGEEVRGGPVYDFYQKIDYSSIFCELEMDGRAELEILPEWTDDIPDKYYFFGTVWLRCLGEEVVMQSEVWYDEPGVLVGEVYAYFVQESIEEK